MTSLQLPVISPAELRAPAPVSERPAQLHFFDSPHREGLLLVNGSRIYVVSRAIQQQLQQAEQSGRLDQELMQLGLHAAEFVDDAPPESWPVRTLSLAVSQKCNLGCTYCYAQGGSFGEPPRQMPLPVALRAVEQLFENASAGDKVHLAFLGGEPLLNREVLQATAKLARDRARNSGIQLGLSVTTNGTLVTTEDADFFEEHAFAVTVSLDGIGETHDQLRPYKSGRGSFDHIINNVRPLLRRQRAMQVSARATVTPQSMDLPVALVELLKLGFHSVGFSPLLASPTGNHQLDADGLMKMLQQMIQCGRLFEESIVAGRRLAFLNMVNALEQIHRGTHRPYPCGAGAGYFGVSSNGNLYACHRFVNDSARLLGTLDEGVQADAQSAWLRTRHVHRQEPCRSCWARYLCGGGCHHEVMSRGRNACDYIRGWLHYCLEAYLRLHDQCPSWFGTPAG